jgi:hypothetical protein
MGEFDVQAARKSGYGDDEILKHLTESRKFDIEGALKSGYDKSEIIEHLSHTSAAPATVPGSQAGHTVPGKTPNERRLWIKSHPKEAEAMGEGSAVGKRELADWAKKGMEHPVLNLAQAAASPITGLLSAPGEVADWAKRGFRNDPKRNPLPGIDNPFAQAYGNLLASVATSPGAGGAAKATAGRAAGGAKAATGFAVDNLVPRLVTDALPPVLVKVLRGLRKDGVDTPKGQAAALFKQANGRIPKTAEEWIAAKNIRDLVAKEDLKSRMPPKPEKPPKPAPPGKGTGTKYGGPGPSEAGPSPRAMTRRGINRAMEPKPPVEGGTEVAAQTTPVARTQTASPAATSVPSKPTTGAQLRSDSIGLERGAAKNSYLANHFTESGLTPEQVEIMPDAKFEMEMLKVGQGLVKRKLLAKGYEKFNPLKPKQGARPYNIMKIEVADTMRRAADGSK